MDEVKKYLKEKYKKPGNVFLGLVHRLDRNVSGIVLLGKTSKGAARLSEQFRNNEIKKIYYAIVEGKVKPSRGSLTHYLKKDENKMIAIASQLPQNGYSKAELTYRTMKVTKTVKTAKTDLYPYHDRDMDTNSNFYSLVKIELKTGRFHQIRAQFSYIGYPIAGDIKYGASKKLSDKSIALCATEIIFKTATTDPYSAVGFGKAREVKTIKIDYPKEWEKFLNL